MSQRRAAVPGDAAPPGEIERQPLYRQVESALIARIAAGEWPPGAALPSEQALAAEYQVAPGTARKAIDQLVAAALLVRRHGSGTFVAPQDWQEALSRFFRLVGDDGSAGLPDARIVRQEIGMANAAEAARLSLRPRSRVLRFLRVRSFGTVPVIVERLVLPSALFGALPRGTAMPLPPMLYEHFGRQFGVLIRNAAENLRAVPACTEEASLLDVAPGHPLLEIDRLSLSVQGTPVEWRISRCNTAHHSYLNRLALVLQLCLR